MELRILERRGIAVRGLDRKARVGIAREQKLGRISIEGGSGDVDVDVDVDVGVDVDGDGGGVGVEMEMFQRWWGRRAVVGPRLRRDIEISPYRPTHTDRQTDPVRPQFTSSSWPAL